MPVVSTTSGRSARNPTSVEVEDLEPLLVVTGVESGRSQMTNFKLAKVLKKIMTMNHSSVISSLDFLRTVNGQAKIFNAVEFYLSFTK